MNGSHWRAYLFRDHPEDELRAWARSLRFFRFVRAGGGLLNDGDRLMAALRFRGREDFLALCAALGLLVERTAEHVSIAADTRGRSFEERTPIQILPEFLQTGSAIVGDVPCYTWVSPGARLEIFVTDAADAYTVTASAVEAAREIERTLEGHAGRIVDPPEDSRYCICPKRYPELWT